MGVDSEMVYGLHATAEFNVGIVFLPVSLFTFDPRPKLYLVFMETLENIEAKREKN